MYEINEESNEATLLLNQPVEMMESFDRLKKVAPSPDHIIPGHDPKVMERYPAVAGKQGLMVRLDEMPKP